MRFENLFGFLMLSFIFGVIEWALAILAVGVTTSMMEDKKFGKDDSRMFFNFFAFSIFMSFFLMIGFMIHVIIGLVMLLLILYIPNWFFSSNGYDLYGGFGAYSFAIIDRFKEIIVVDGNSAAVQAANAHAKEHGINNFKAVNDSCENFLEKKLSLEQAKRVTHLIVNPSRAGMSPNVLKAISPASLSCLKELHYISCSPPTFARDALSLMRFGLTLTDLVPFDMFPQTDHVEVGAKFINNSVSPQS